MPAAKPIENNVNLQVALQWAAEGFPIMPLRWQDAVLKNGQPRKAKSPLWADYMDMATSSAPAIRRTWSKDPQLLVGVLTEEFDVVDLDRHKDRDGFASLAKIGLKLKSPMSAKTAGNGEHHFFAKTPGLCTTHGVLPGIDIKSRYRNGTASYIVAPGTVAPWGRYTWLGGNPGLLRDLIDLGGLATIPEALWPPEKDVERITAEAAVDQSDVPGAVAFAHDMAERAKRVVRAAAEMGNRTPALFDQAVHLGTFVACNTLTTEEAETALLEAAESVGLTADYGDDVLRQIRNGLEAGMQHPKVWVSPAEHANVDLTEEDAPPPADDDGPDFGSPLTAGNGKPFSNQHNADHYLARDRDTILPGLRWNEMTERAEWGEGEVRDPDLSRARKGIERWLGTVAMELVLAAVRNVAAVRAYHPIREWLVAQADDGRSLLDTWMVDYLGAEDSPYTRAISRMFAVQMVARIMEPGCKADYMPVLWGDQGQRKSEACRALAGGLYFSDSLPPISDETAAMLHLRGLWLVEVAELASVSKSGVERVKAFMTRRVDRYRSPYGRMDEPHPRQCVLIGTSNKEQFLKDETGGRRFWPVHVVRPCDPEGLARDRGQLFAEALWTYRAGEHWWPSADFEREHITPLQEAARQDDPWAEEIADFLATNISGEIGDPAKPRRETTMAEIMGPDCLNLPAGQRTPATQQKVGAILKSKRIGWAMVKSHGRKVWRPIKSAHLSVVK